MKPGELYKPVGFDCVLLCVGPDTFTVEAGECPFHEDPTAANGEYPLGGKITFSPTPPMHRAWHWSDLATPAETVKAGDSDHELMMSVVCNNGGLETLVINNKIYLYENNL